MNTKQKKALYESIMKSVAKTVKKALNENNSYDVWPCSLKNKVYFGDGFYTVTVNIDLRKALSPETYASLDIVNDIIQIEYTHYMRGGGRDYAEAVYPDWLLEQDDDGFVDEEILNYCVDIEDAVEHRA